MLVAATTNTRALWYLTRGTGLVTLVLLTLSVVLGIVETVRWASDRWPRFVVAGLHKNVSLLVMLLLAIHIVTSIVDGFAPIRWLDTVVPFSSAYRPVWLGLGALATDLLIAVIVTSLVRQHIGYQAWRVVHWTAYACWPLAVVHGFGAGTDTRLGWVLLLNLACLAAVLAAIWWRLATGWPAQSGPRTAAGVASVITPIAVLAWLVTGPMKSGWARHAGTPATILGRASASPTPGGTSTAGPAATTLQPPFSGRLTGTLSQTGPDSSGESTVTIDATLTQGANGKLHVVLKGPGDRAGGIRMQQSSATLGPTGQTDLYQGDITALQGTAMTVSLRDRAGQALSLAVQLQIDQSGNVTGTVQATRG